MDSIREQWFDSFKLELIRQVQDLAEPGVAVEIACVDMLGVSLDDLQQLLRKYTMSLPNQIISSDKQAQLKLQVPLIEQFILFIAQEDIDDESFMDHYACFMMLAPKTLLMQLGGEHA